jgi:hypothetical protein
MRGLLAVALLAISSSALAAKPPAAAAAPSVERNVIYGMVSGASLQAIVLRAPPIDLTNMGSGDSMAFVVARRLARLLRRDGALARHAPQGPGSSE